MESREVKWNSLSLQAVLLECRALLPLRKSCLFESTELMSINDVYDVTHSRWRLILLVSYSTFSFLRNLGMISVSDFITTLRVGWSQSQFS